MRASVVSGDDNVSQTQSFSTNRNSQQESVSPWTFAGYRRGDQMNSLLAK